MNARALLRPLLALLGVTVAASGVPLAAAQDLERPVRVYVITVDGLDPDEVGVLTPNLAALKAAGTWYEQARAVFPAETLPNHVAMATGVLPAVSGIVGNQYWEMPPVMAEQRSRFYMQDPSMLAADTIVTRLENACDTTGVQTATVMSKTYLYGVFGGEPANPADDHRQRQADFHWKAPVYIPQSDHILDAATMDAFTSWLAQQPADRPQFGFVNLGDVDRSGHADESGVGGQVSGFRQAALSDTDELIGRFVDDLKANGSWGDTVLILNSDHGMDWGPQSNRVDITATLTPAGYKANGGNNTAGTADFIAISGGGSGLVYVHNQRHIEPIARLLAAHPGVEFIATRDPVEGLNNPTLAQMGIDHPNSPDIEIFVKPGWHVDDTGHQNPLPGNHGHPVTQRSTMLVTGGHEVLRDVPLSVPGEAVYDPAHRLFADPVEGPGNLSVAPTVAALFGLTAPDSPYAVGPLREAFDDGALPHPPACDPGSDPVESPVAPVPPSGPALLTAGATVASANTSTATYEVLVRNEGGETARNAVVEVTVPAGQAFDGAEPAPQAGSCDRGAPTNTVCRWQLGDIAGGASATVLVTTVWVGNTSGGSITTTASADGLPAFTDSNFSTLDRESAVLTRDTLVGDTDVAGTNRGACATLPLHGREVVYIDGDNVPPNVTYPTYNDQTYYGADVVLDVAETTATAERPVRIEARAVRDADWDEGTGPCEGSAGSGRQARAGASPAAGPLLDAVDVTGVGALRLDVLDAMLTKRLRFDFNGVQLRVPAADGGTVGLSSSEGSVQAALPRLEMVSREHDRFASCVDADADEATTAAGDAVRIDVRATRGGRAVNGTTDGCGGRPVVGVPVYLRIEQEGTDVRFATVNGLAVASEDASGSRGPDLVEAITDAHGLASVTLRAISGAGDVRVAAQASPSGGATEPGGSPFCGTLDACSGEGSQEDDVVVHFR